MPKKPKFLSQVYYRTGKTGKQAVPKGLPGALNKLASQRIGILSLPELKAVARPIIREAKLRMRELEKAGLEDTPAYQFIRRNSINLSAAGTDINQIRSNVMKAFDFLHTATSVVENASEYVKKIEEWFPGMDKEGRKSVFDAIRRLEDLYPNRFTKPNYDSEYRKVGRIAKSIGLDSEAIIDAFTSMVKSEEEKALEEARELTKEGRSLWRDGNSI